MDHQAELTSLLYKTVDVRAEHKGIELRFTGYLQTFNGDQEWFHIHHYIERANLDDWVAKIKFNATAVESIDGTHIQLDLSKVDLSKVE